jgi:transposase
VLGAIQRGGELRVRVVENAEGGTIKAFLQDVVSDDAEAIYTDSHRSYRGIADENTRHEWVNHAADEWVRGNVHTNTVESAWSLFDRSVIGSYHKLSTKHLQAYLDEFAFRFNNRKNPHLFRDTILRLVESDAMPYAELVHG